LSVELILVHRYSRVHQRPLRHADLAARVMQIDFGFLALFGSFFKPVRMTATSPTTIEMAFDAF
jgi:hypothetical protein